jgi:tetratricopeptide (TPR) repeat protein
MTETQDVSLLRDVRDLKRRSRRYRERDQLERAAEALQRALELMEPRVRAHDPAFETAGGIASQALRDLAAELADCYGSMAGIRRRFDQLDVALDLYGKGRQLELTKAYRIGNTYNQVQWLVLQVLLRPALITGNDAVFAGEIDKTLQVLDEQVRTTRAQDPWAYSDIGLLRTLRGQESRAEEAWDEVDGKKPISDVYESGLPVLTTLSAALPGHQALENAMRRFQARLDEMRPS